jgi:hypothetical protein
MLTRREFVIKTGTLAAVSTVGLTSSLCKSSTSKSKTMKPVSIQAVNSNFEREPLIRPFGFKGGYMSEIWQTMSWMQSESGIEKVGLCTQSVLWSDASVFRSHSEAGGNAIMYLMTERAMQMVKGQKFSSPVELLDNILEEVYDYGVKISGRANLRKTFALNALVGLDNAAWLLYAAENGITNFDDLIPGEYRPALSHHHEKVASIPLMAYTIPIDEIRQAADEGYFFMKIKIGQPGTQSAMLEKDKARLTEIHKAIGHMETPYSQDGKLPYYFDANGRYEEKETLLRLLDHAREIGAYDKRIEMGYRAIALKAIAKTLSMTMKIANVAKKHDVPCFCADLTVNPILVDWNKAVAARLDPFPGMGIGLLETNGHQNYSNWETMFSYHPYNGASWTKTKGGVFELNDDYYAKSGGILTDSEHYLNLFRKK